MISIAVFVLHGEIKCHDNNVFRFFKNQFFKKDCLLRGDDQLWIINFHS